MDARGKPNSRSKLKRVLCNCFAIKNASTRPNLSARHQQRSAIGARSLIPERFFFFFFSSKSQDRVDSMATRERIYASIKLHQADCSIDPSMHRNKLATSLATWKRLLYYSYFSLLVVDADSNHTGSNLDFVRSRSKLARQQYCKRVYAIIGTDHRNYR